MKRWECGVCGYVDKGEEAPEKCPVCEAPKKMFLYQEGKPQAEAVEEGDGTSADGELKWLCSVCNHSHSGAAPPENCPVCQAPASMFAPAAENGTATPDAAQTAAAPATPASSASSASSAATAGPAAPAAVAAKPASRRWRCTLCGYIHSGAEPPAKCPACGADRTLFVEIDAGNKVIGPLPAAAATAAAPAKKKSGLLNWLAGLVLKLHLHPITVHFPNGILPVVVIFLGLAIWLTMLSAETVAFLETAAFYNLICVLAVLPVVLFTGYLEWQKRYLGAKTALFIIKILCALVVLGGVNVLVFWRLLDPAVAAADSPHRLLYFGVAVATLAAAGIAGHLGGKLVFAGRK